MTCQPTRLVTDLPGTPGHGHSGKRLLPAPRDLKASTA